MKFQLDLGSDLALIILQTWKRLGTPTMIKSSKITRSVTGKNNFEGESIINTTFNVKTLKLKFSVLKNSDNLFDTDWITQFQLWDLPVNSYTKKKKLLFGCRSWKTKKTLKEANPQSFSGGLRNGTKMMAKYELRVEVRPVFKKKRNLPFAWLEQINKKLDRLIKTGDLPMLEYSEWTALSIPAKKEI